jgi:nickel superoxide dismutase
MSMVVATTVAMIGLTQAWAHCQIPCGIYDDPARFTALVEHLTTIEKSMKQINELSSGEPADHVNQLVRWVGNKETHAKEFTEIVTYYFMAQRVKPAVPSDEAAYAKYVSEVTLLHRMVVGAMKCKQTTDLEHVKALRELVAAFKKSYMTK